MIRILSILLFALPMSASAAIISGDITGGTANNRGGTFMELTDLDGLILSSDGYNDANLRAFNERQNVVSDQVIETDVGRDVAIGEVVASHYMIFDPRLLATAVATIMFDAPIIGVATSDGNLSNSDHLVHGGVTYPTVGSRGLEGIDVVTLFNDNPYRLDLSIRAGSPGDYIRVFTETSQLAIAQGTSELVATPLPSAAALLPVGFGIYAFSRRAFGARRKKKPAF